MTPDQHRAFGRHSGIPDCCIEEWLTRDARDLVATRLGYFPCDACRAAKRIAKIHTCGPACADFLRRELKHPSWKTWVSGRPLARSN